MNNILFAFHQTGAADFLPERAVLEDGSLSSTFLDFSTVMDKVNSWLGKVKVSSAVDYSVKCAS